MESAGFLQRLGGGGGSDLWPYSQHGEPEGHAERGFSAMLHHQGRCSAGQPKRNPSQPNACSAWAACAWTSPSRWPTPTTISFPTLLARNWALRRFFLRALVWLWRKALLGTGPVASAGASQERWRWDADQFWRGNTADAATTGRLDGRGFQWRHSLLFVVSAVAGRRAQLRAAGEAPAGKST